MAAGTTPIATDWMNQGSRPNKAYTSDGLVAGAVMSDRPGLLISVVATNTSASDAYVQIHDKAALPADGVAPLISIKVPAGEAMAFTVPTVLSVGLYICQSSTAATKTLTGATMLIHAQFRNG